MFVSDWMTKKVFTLSPDDSISTAATLTKEKNIKHLPVLKGKRLKGLLSDRDIRHFVPSRATSLDIYELHSLYSRIKVKEVMKTRVITTTEHTPIEEAAMLMHDNNIGCLPVLQNTKLIGIISDRDIFEVLVDITGVRHRGHRIFLTVHDQPQAIKDVTDIIRKHGFGFHSILTSCEGAKKGYRNIVVRAKGAGNFSKLNMELAGTYTNIDIRKG